MNLVLLGAPGAGKGTQCGKISAKLKIPQISTGDILRKHISLETELGILAKSYIDKGLLVPDDLAVEIVKERLKEPDCKNGFILDGFPRTLKQAQELFDIVEIDKVINLDIKLEYLTERLIKRRICSDCGEIFNTGMHKVNICGKCGGSLFQRKDDNESTIKLRMLVYLKQTKPLIEFYKNEGKLINIITDDSPEVVFQRICSVLE